MISSVLIFLRGGTAITFPFFCSLKSYKHELYMLRFDAFSVGKPVWPITKVTLGKSIQNVCSFRETITFGFIFQILK